MRSRETIGRRIAGELIRIGAVVFSPERPFTWASGIQAPVYVDNRLTMGYPSVRRLIVEGFIAVMEGEGVSADVVVGTATAGIPHAAWLAERLDLPMAYVRASAKTHGRRNKVEGFVEPGARGVVVEDLVSTGGSSLDVVATLRSAGVDVAAVMAIFSYGLKDAAAAFAREDVPLYALTDFDTLQEIASSTGNLTSHGVEVVRAWHERLVAGEAPQRSR